MMSPAKPWSSAACSARQQEGRQLGGDREGFAPLELDRAARAAELGAEIDQRPAREIDALVDVMANEIVERRPAQQRADHAGVGDRNFEGTGDIGAERGARAVPQPERRVEVELPSKPVSELPHRLEPLIVLV